MSSTFKQILLTAFIILSTYSLSAQESIFFSNIDKYSYLVRANGYSYLGKISWYTSDCLYSKNNICRNTAHGGARILIRKLGDGFQQKLLTPNNSGYQRPSFDTLIYNINLKRESFLIRKLYFEKKFTIDTPFVVDTLRLHLVDSLIFQKGYLIKKVLENGSNKQLKVYVFCSGGSEKDSGFHFWVEGVGIIKVVYSNCWRYSFELTVKDYLPRNDYKLFEQVLKLIKSKYKDPSWFNAPCEMQNDI